MYTQISFCVIVIGADSTSCVDKKTHNDYSYYIYAVAFMVPAVFFIVEVTHLMDFSACKAFSLLIFHT
jgi:hypothetical protein